MSVGVFVCLSLCLVACLSGSLSACLSVCIFVSPPVVLPISFCLFVTHHDVDTGFLASSLVQEIRIVVNGDDGDDDGDDDCGVDDGIHGGGDHTVHFQTFTSVLLLLSETWVNGF